MKSIYSIFVAAAFSSTLCAAAERYSLWPRRPAEIEQAQRLLQANKAAEAVQLLQPLISMDGIAGQEARQIVGSVNVGTYLSLRHPGAAVYTVKKGDNLAKIASAVHCPFELMMLLNGLVDPASMHVGQKLVYVPMKQQLEIVLPRREVLVWNGQTLVASYKLSAVEGVSGSVAEEQTSVSARDGYVAGGKIPAWSPMMGSSERSLVLGNGVVLSAGQGSGGKVLRMAQADLNELALLVGVGNPVTLVYKAADIPDAGQQIPAPAPVRK